MSSSTKIDNREKDILILAKGPTQDLEQILSTAKMYSINFTEKNKTLCLSLHDNNTNSYLSIKNTKILPYPLSLGNISKDLPVDNMKKTGMLMFMMYL